jgi:hypothetical protein
MIFIDSWNKPKFLLGEGETEDESLCSQIGVLVVPISLSYAQARLLVSELQTDELECVVN